MTLKEGLMVKVTNTLKEDAKGLQTVYSRMMTMEGQYGVILWASKYGGTYRTALVKVDDCEYYLHESLISVAPMYKEG